MQKNDMKEIREMMEQVISEKVAEICSAVKGSVRDEFRRLSEEDKEKPLHVRFTEGLNCAPPRPPTAQEGRMQPMTKIRTDFSQFTAGSSVERTYTRPAVFRPNIQARNLHHHGVTHTVSRKKSIRDESREDAVMEFSLCQAPGRHASADLRPNGHGEQRNSSKNWYGEQRNGSKDSDRSCFSGQKRGGVAWDSQGDQSGVMEPHGALRQAGSMAFSDAGGLRTVPSVGDNNLGNLCRTGAGGRVASKERPELPLELMGMKLGKWRQKAAVLVNSPLFDWTVCGVILLNALLIGIQTDYTARTLLPPSMDGFFVAEVAFCVAFTSEIVLRLFVFRLKFFCSRQWAWNVFDFTLVALQLTENLFLIGNGGEMPNFGFARLLKLLRLARALRVVRIARLIRELRTLVKCMTTSLKALGWTSMLLGMLIYTVSLVTTNVVTDHRKENLGAEGDEMLDKYYGNLLLSMLTLFQCISGGDDWGVLLHPLRGVSEVFSILFLFYISFAIFAIMNMVTGIFVDSTLASAKQDKELFLIANAREIFRDVKEGGLTLQQFVAKVDEPEMQEFFKSIDVDPSQAQLLFQLVDLNDNGEIDAEEFFAGCIRLNGAAKAIDTQVLVQEVCKISERIINIEMGLERRSAEIPSPTSMSRFAGQA